MGILKSYKTIATIETRNSALSLKETILVKVDAKTMILGLLFLAVLLSFMARWVYVHIESPNIPITFIIVMYALVLFSRKDELLSIRNKHPLLAIDKAGVNYNKSLFTWEQIDKIEFLKSKTNEGFDYIRLHLVNGDTKDIAYPENATQKFEQLASQLERLETKFYV